MARILLLDDNRDRRDSTRRALGGHLVDSLGHDDNVVALLESRPPYDLALVGLNPTVEDDREGDELFDLLVALSPSTRRVVMTGWPPRRPDAAGIFDRYPVDEIIVWGDLDTQQLRRAIENTLTLEQGRRQLPAEAKIQRSQLRQAVKDARRVLGAELRDQIVGMEEYVEATFQVHGQGRRIDQEIDRARATLQEFEATFDRLERKVDRISSVEAAHAVRRELQKLEALHAAGRGRWGRPE